MLVVFHIKKGEKQMKKKWLENLMMDLKYSWKEEGVHVAKMLLVAGVLSLLTSFGLPPVEVDLDRM